MRTVTKAVHHKGRHVGDVDVPVYETVDELIAAESEQTILNMFNKQNAIRLQANERAKHTEGRMGKQKRRELAFNLLSADEIAQFSGNMAGLQEYLDSEEMQRRVAESQAEAAV